MDNNERRLNEQIHLKDQIIKLQSELIEQLKAQPPTDELRALRQRVKADSLNKEEAHNLFSKRGWGSLGQTHLRNCLDQIYKLEEQLAVCFRRAEDDRRLITNLLNVAKALRVAGNPSTSDPLVFAEAERALAAKPSEAGEAQSLREERQPSDPRFVPTDYYRGASRRTPPPGYPASTDPKDPLDSDQPSGTKEPT